MLWCLQLQVMYVTDIQWGILAVFTKSAKTGYFLACGGVGKAYNQAVTSKVVWQAAAG